MGKHTTVYEAVSGTRHTTLSPDELLAEQARAPSAIPVRERCATFQPPESDLLEAIHYYVAKMYPEKYSLFDESALLALGYLVEHWLDEMTNDVSHNLYAEITTNKRPRKRKHQLDSVDETNPEGLKKGGEDPKI